jgi:hypothetical protein
MFDGVRPFDWIMLAVEVAVLLLIAFEIGAEIFRKRKTKRLSNKAFEFLQRSQLLKGSAPKTNSACGPKGPHGEKVVQSWLEAVEQWNQETVKFLESCSPQARAAFLVSEEEAFQQEILTVPVDAQWWYGTLSTRAMNLQRIAENPEVYF